MAKEKSNIEKTKENLLKRYKEQLDEIFSPENFALTFDQREQLIDGKMSVERNNIIEEHIEKDPEGITNEPPATYLCPDGTEATLCTDANGNPKIFEREIKTKSGPITIKEYGYYSSKDRKIFFPSQENS